MGLLGVVAILAAPSIGRVVNRYSPRRNIQISWCLDLSTQFSQVTNQAIIQSLSRKANSRNNSIFMFSYFFGGSLGTLTGINAWSMYHWTGVTTAAVVLLLLSLLNYYWQGVPATLGE